jgi:Big-like domain-containing protein
MRACVAFVVSSAVFAAACGSGSKNTPSAPSSTISEIRVGVAGSAPAVVEPGKTAQLFAQAVLTDGSTQDVTNTAVWQTSNPTVATVSPAGLVTTYVEGEATITATFGKAGSLALQVKKECVYTLSPPSLDTDAFGRTVKVSVTASLASCKWTARSDVSWVKLVGPAEGTGSGSFEYDLRGNSTPDARAADIIVSGDRGTALHHITQARPASCSYVVDPNEVAVGLGGGSGSFRVDTTPDDCRWTATSSGSAYATNASSYNPTQGDFVVKYTAYANTAGKEATISICGLSGTNPCGIFTVRWRN